MNNHRVRETCLICEGRGKNGPAACSYCAGSGHVFSRTADTEVVQMTGDCKIPMKRVTAEGLKIERQFSA